LKHTIPIYTINYVFRATTTAVNISTNYNYLFYLWNIWSNRINNTHPFIKKEMKKKYIITGVIGLALGVGIWFIVNNKKKKTRVIREGTFIIEVDDEE